MKTSREACRVYFIKPVGMDGPIKIGCSKFPDMRLLALSKWSPWPLEIIGAVPGVRADEMYVHSCFSALHSHHEWFRTSPELREGIKLILAANSVTALDGKYQPNGNILSLAQRKRNWTEDQSRCFSYAQRVLWAIRRLRADGKQTLYRAPDDVEAIIWHWKRSRTPTLDEFIRLEAYLKNPEPVPNTTGAAA